MQQHSPGRWLSIGALLGRWESMGQDLGFWHGALAAMGGSVVALVGFGWVLVPVWVVWARIWRLFGVVVRGCV